MRGNSQWNHRPGSQRLTGPITQKTLQKVFVLAMASQIVLGSMPLFVQAQVLDTGAKSSKAVRGQVAISRDVSIAAANDKISLNLRDANLRDVLQALAKQGKFNLILDESVTGTLTVDIKDISVNKALEYIFTASNLSYAKDGNTIIVATKEKADEKNMTAKTFKAIPVLYKDAFIVASQLNNTIFKVPRPNGSTSALAAYDADSNSLLVMGTDADIKLVGNALRELDVPRNRKVYHIQHNTPNYVAQVLVANFFSTANPTTGAQAGGGAGAQTGGGAGAQTGGAGAQTGGGAGAQAGGTGAQAGGGAGVQAGGGAQAGGTNGSLSYTMGGVTFIPEPISATLTVLGTDEQLALIDSIIDQVDVRRPQVEVEVSLVELQNSDLRSLVPSWGNFGLGKETSLSLNNGGANLLTLNRNNLPSTGYFTETFSVRNSHKTIRGKILANPTVVAMDGTASEISITDQVPSISSTISITNNNPVVTATITTQEAGVKVTFTPTIYNDGSVELKLNPDVSQPIRTVTATTGSGATAATVSTMLISKRTLNLQGVRIRDGQTLVIGGLLRESTSSDIDKVPGLDRLPIVRAMFNATNKNDKERTELVLMVTPHILKEEAVTYFDKMGQGVKYSNPNQGQGFQPINLPKFTGGVNPASSYMAIPTGSPQTTIPTANVQHGLNRSNQPAQMPLQAPKQDTAVTPESIQSTEAFGLPVKLPDSLQQAKQRSKKPRLKKESRAEVRKEEVLPRLELMEEVLKN